MSYMLAFVFGGFLCVIAQLLIDFTKLTPARILVSYVVAGVILTFLGLYQPLVEWFGANRIWQRSGKRGNERSFGKRIFRSAFGRYDSLCRRDFRRHLFWTDFFTDFLSQRKINNTQKKGFIVNPFFVCD